ncbi:hypothetical protein [Bacillus sp. PS06]|uniref:hypothetical protein n=1 Tax=Bacillus sp. PS06 TaxID=2764176 RepID=UPI001786B87C|nr:hypothetical protein [Bacillus sp. PS06]MBD8069311.1 hypothetical protein [Bacillus sp. PS06]
MLTPQDAEWIQVAIIYKKTVNIKKERVNSMRFSEKGQHSHQATNGLFGVDLHHFVKKEQEATYVELASEFGISVNDVRKLKKQLDRS